MQIQCNVDWVQNDQQGEPRELKLALPENTTR